MQSGNDRHLFFAALISLALHAMGFALASGLLPLTTRPAAAEPEDENIVVEMLPPPEKSPPKAAPQPPAPLPVTEQTIQLLPVNPATTPATHQPATRAAPPAPTAEEWAFAASYTLKNSKGYRHAWGKQVRSMMGTAVEGPDQGAVRFRIEIAPDGTLAKLETLWATSAVAERLARDAIRHLPPLPPTPTGKPLIFEKTIVFSAFATDSPPLYRDDCLPDPPAFNNPYAWDGKSPQAKVAPRSVEKPDPQALEECIKQLPQDSIEAEAAHSHRLQEAVRY